MFFFSSKTEVKNSFSLYQDSEFPHSCRKFLSQQFLASKEGFLNSITRKKEKKSYSPKEYNTIYRRHSRTRTFETKKPFTQ